MVHVLSPRFAINTTSIFIKRNGELQSMSFVLTIYLLQNYSIAIFYKTGTKLDDNVSGHISGNIHICGDFNIHKQWLDYAYRKYLKRKHYYCFSITNELTQMVGKLTRIPDAAINHANQCSAEILPPLRTSDSFIDLCQG